MPVGVSRRPGNDTQNQARRATQVPQPRDCAARWAGEVGWDCLRGLTASARDVLASGLGCRVVLIGRRPAELRPAASAEAAHGTDHAAKSEARLPNLALFS